MGNMGNNMGMGMMNGPGPMINQQMGNNRMGNMPMQQQQNQVKLFSSIF